MIIRHKEIKKPINISIADWNNNYIKKEVHEEFEIIDTSDIAEFWYLNDETGKLQFMCVWEVETIKKWVEDEPNKSQLKEMSYKKYDKYLNYVSYFVGQRFAEIRTNQIERKNTKNYKTSYNIIQSLGINIKTTLGKILLGVIILVLGGLALIFVRGMLGL